MKHVPLLAVLLFTAPGVLHAQQPGRPAETSTDVPALRAFHVVIAEIWHGAWPKKDTGRLAALLPQVEGGVSAVAKAELPGILRERRAAWDQRLKELQLAAAGYRKAVESGEDRALLDAAEKLHTQYEMMVRAIRPPLRELDEFHAGLYMLYHYFMPGDSVEKMKESGQFLKQKMALLNVAVLPESLKERGEQFSGLRKDLSQAVEQFAAAASAGDLQEMKLAAAKVHEHYLALEKSLE